MAIATISKSNCNSSGSVTCDSSSITFWLGCSDVSSLLNSRDALLFLFLADLRTKTF